MATKTAYRRAKARLRKVEKLEKKLQRKLAKTSALADRLKKKCDKLK